MPTPLEDTKKTASLFDNQLNWRFDLPLEQLMGQVGAAADRAVASPEKYQAIIKAIVGPRNTQVLVTHRSICLRHRCL